MSKTKESGRALIARAIEKAGSISELARKLSYDAAGLARLTRAWNGRTKNPAHDLIADVQAYLERPDEPEREDRDDFLRRSESFAAAQPHAAYDQQQQEAHERAALEEALRTGDVIIARGLLFGRPTIGLRMGFTALGPPADVDITPLLALFGMRAEGDE